MKLLRTTISTFKMLIAVIIAPLLAKKYSSVWIVGERRNQARDNGYCFFKYVRTHYPNSNIFYIIDKSNDMHKILDLGNVIVYNSFMHYLMFALAKVHISSHANIFWPDDVRKIGFIVNRIRFKKVFLPHGVSYGYTPWATKSRAHFDLFFCSGQLEYQNVLENYGYTQQEVTYVGIPRLDLWHEPIEVNRKQILLMPTWRAHIVYDQHCNFVETDYFKAYQQVLDSVELQNFLQHNDLKLIFYLHHDMQRYADLFTTNCKNIEVVKNDQLYDIQNLLRTSALLITDYSSVHFDFAYMKKPVIYYQFDAEEFFTHQYQKATFSAEKHGFGPVAYNSEQLIDYLIKSKHNEFELTDVYYCRMRDFYRIYDDKNSERVYQVINSNL